MNTALQTQRSPVIAVSAGVDWYSASLRKDSDDYVGWRTIIYDCVSSLRDEGYDIKTGGLYGYRGFFVGGSFMGERDDGSYVQLAGQYADWMWLAVHRHELSVSRIDIQVTAQYEREPDDIASYEYEAIRSGENKAIRSAQTSARLLASVDGASTLYVGTPKSSQRARLYNKGQQSKDKLYENSWRYEVTMINELADKLANELYRTKHNRTGQIHAAVAHWFGKRGIVLDLPNPDVIPIQVAKSRVTTDTERRLSWLRKTVRRTVATLIADGYEQQVLEALGLLGEGKEGLDK
jgi:hypothetical protein